MLIRQATDRDFSILRRIELAAFVTLRDAGAVSGAPEASSDAELRQYLDHKLLYVMVDANGGAQGYCGGYVVDGWLHIGEMDVHPDFQKQGIGRRLMEALIREGRARGLRGATLTTDRFARFNAPFYTSMGFRPAEMDDCWPRLRDILETEVAKGLDPNRRVAMLLSF